MKNKSRKAAPLESAVHFWVYASIGQQFRVVVFDESGTEAGPALEQQKQDDMNCNCNNCMPGPFYPLNTERTLSQSCMGAGHEVGSVRQTVSVRCTGTIPKVTSFLLTVGVRSD